MQKRKDTPQAGEFRSGPIAGTSIISGVNFAQKALQYANVDGLAIFEGDIVLGTMEEMQVVDTSGGFIAHGVGITGQQFRWPNATIPYDIDPNMPSQQRVTDAIAHWEANTRIRFVLRTAQNAAQNPDFVHFQSGGGCSSAVGRRGNQQNITLGNGCTLGNAIHEIGHTVGLWHEQSREDRDNFVSIVWANIDPNMQHNFNQHIADGDDYGTYDYGSIMHYPPTAFSTNNQATIIALQPIPAGVVMGQRNGLSQGDIAAVHAMYPPIVKMKEIGKDPILDTFKEVRKDPVRETLKEIQKDPIRDTIKELRKDPIQDTFKELRKDPIQDTFKELRKDPLDDTIKEVRKDPIFDTVEKGPFGDPIFNKPFTELPFIMSRPSRVSGYNDADELGQVMAEIQELAEAISLHEQSYEALVQAYEEALIKLETLQKGK